MAAKSEVTDLVQYYELDMVKKLVNDSQGEITDKAVLDGTSPPSLIATKALSAASGRILASLKQGGHYTEDDITALTGDGAEHYKQIECSVAMSILLRRKPMYYEAERSAILEEAENYLEDLRKGKNVLNIDVNISAGKPNPVHMPEPTVIQLQQNTLVTKTIGKVFPYRN